MAKLLLNWDAWNVAALGPVLGGTPCRRNPTDQDHGRLKMGLKAGMAACPSKVFALSP
jgi:hypothetical protein